MTTSLRDDLASLKIDRDRGRGSGSWADSPTVGRTPRNGPGFFGLLSVLLWLIPIGLVAAGGYFAYTRASQLRAKTEVNVGLVQAMTTGEAETLLSAKGYIKSRNQAEIGAQVPGRVESMYVEEGDRVKKGQVLAILEHGEIKAQRDSRQAMVARTKAELREAEADYEMKERKAQRWAQLLARNTATVEETDQYISDRNKARAHVAQLKAAIDLQNSMVHETEETIKNMHIIAPFDGTVVSKEAEVGETITPGGMGQASGRGSVVTLANLEMLEVETDVAENLLSRITVGQPAEVAVSAVPGRHYKGRLRQIIPMGDRTRGTVKVNVQVLDPDEKLFPELVATVHFLPDKSLENPNAGKTFLFAPKDAIVEEAGHSYVWVVDTRDAVHRRQVEAVVTNDSLARVEKGLEAGDKVVLNPPKTIKEGEAVRIAD